MPSWNKLAAGWVLTVMIALGVSWGAIAQVRNRVEQPSTVIPPSALAGADALSKDVLSPTSTTSALERVRVEPSIPELSETTSTSLVGDTELAADESVTQPQTASATSSLETTSTTQAAPSSVGTTSTTLAESSSPTTSSTTTTTQLTTSSSSTSTTVTSAEPSTQTATYVLAGGSVTIRFSPGVVTYLSAVPSGGFSTEVKNTGPEEVRVTFKSDDHESDFRAEWEDGELSVTKKENDED